MNLEVTEVPLGDVDPNPWNPNKQTDRQFAAEVESICDHGFVMPIIVRANGKRWQIIDGEHRWRALSQIVEEKKSGAGNIADLTDRGVIPSIVLNVDDAYAKKLTVILNETRGRADFGSLSELLVSIQEDFGDDLISGLPYTPQHLQELLSISDFDWSALEVTDDLGDVDSHDPALFKIVALLDADGEAAWAAAVEARRESLPKDKKEIPGALIAALLKEAQND